MFRTELMEARPRHGLRGQPSSDAESGSAKPRIPRASSLLPFQIQEIPLLPRINHKSPAATMPFRVAE
jgi:hypothetical protein